MHVPTARSLLPPEQEGTGAAFQLDQHWPWESKGYMRGNYHPTTSPKEAGGFPGAADGKPSNLAWPRAGDYREDSNKTQLGLGIPREEFHTTVVFCFKKISKEVGQTPYIFQTQASSFLLQKILKILFSVLFLPEVVPKLH